MADSPRYTIRTLEDISQIPTNRLEAFLGDLRSALFLGRSSSNLADASAKGLNPKLKVSCTLTEMDWVDDGTGDLNPEFDGKRTSHIPGAQVTKILNGFNALAGHVRARNSQAHTR